MLWQYLRTSTAFSFAVMAAMIGLVPGIAGVREAVRTHRRLKGFYPATARILDRRSIGGRGGPSYFFRVEYPGQDRRLHQSKVGASKPEYLASRVNDDVAVYVSGIDPSDAWLASHGAPNYTAAIVSGAITAILLAPVTAVVPRLRSRVAVLRYGQRATGRVEEVPREKRIRLKTPYQYFVIWSYTAPGGREYKRRSIHVPQKVAYQWRRRKEIPVYFDPLNPSRAEADVFGLKETAL